MLDDDELEAMSPGTRAAAERDLNRRQGREGRGMDDLIYDEDDDKAVQTRRRWTEGEDAADGGDKIENIEDTKVILHEASFFKRDTPLSA